MNHSNDFAVLQLNSDLTYRRTFSTVVSALLLSIGVVGNIIVVFIYTFKVQRREVRYFLPILAITDLCACAIGCAFSIIQNTMGVIFPGYELCKILYYSTFLFSTSSAVLLFVIAVERYRKVCMPFKKQMTLKWKRIALGLTFAFSFILPLPLFRFIENGEMNHFYIGQNITIRTCSLKQFGGEMQYLRPLRTAYFIFTNVITIANMVVTASLYIPIGRKIYITFKSLRKSHNVQNPQCTNSSGNTDPEEESSCTFDSQEDDIHKTVTSEPKQLKHVGPNTLKKNVRRRRVRNNFTLMFMTIVCVYVIAYMPTEVMLILGFKPTFWINLSTLKLNILILLERMFLFNHVVNPFIYGFFDLTFRHLLHEMINRCLGNKSTKIKL